MRTSRCTVPASGVADRPTDGFVVQHPVTHVVTLAPIVTTSSVIVPATGAS
jgi:hypothetical protein